MTLLRLNETPRPALCDVVSSHTSLREENKSIHPRLKNAPWFSALYDKQPTTLRSGFSWNSSIHPQAYGSTLLTILSLPKDACGFLEEL